MPKRWRWSAAIGRNPKIAKIPAGRERRGSPEAHGTTWSADGHCRALAARLHRARTRRGPDDSALDLDRYASRVDEKLVLSDSSNEDDTGGLGRAGGDRATDAVSIELSVSRRALRAPNRSSGEIQMKRTKDSFLLPGLGSKDCNGEIRSTLIVGNARSKPVQHVAAIQRHRGVGAWIETTGEGKKAWKSPWIDSGKRQSGGKRRGRCSGNGLDFSAQLNFKMFLRVGSVYKRNLAAFPHFSPI
ncbi:hypothetical protein B0H10DRAFT_1944797 [Mycena sp. CBHHK59/15]|nr:hypothetical protein B0H10DRAFT_1944797 [Mycena sp. CBHHK59/15]